jgi:RNA polymerase sigma factor (sigma-70 family)
VDLDRIITGCKNNDKQSQARLYQYFAPKLMAICIRYLRDREDAKDILQEVFIKAFTKIDSFSGTGSFEGWIKRIAVNSCIDFLKKKISVKPYADQVAAAEVEEEYDDNLLIPQEILMELIASLADGYRFVLNLYAIEQYSHKEIAEMLDISEGTSRSQYARAKKVLQHKIEDYLQRKTMPYEI